MTHPTHPFRIAVIRREDAGASRSYTRARRYASLGEAIRDLTRVRGELEALNARAPWTGAVGCYVVADNGQTWATVPVGTAS